MREAVVHRGETHREAEGEQAAEVEPWKLA